MLRIFHRYYAQSIEVLTARKFSIARIMHYCVRIIWQIYVLLQLISLHIYRYFIIWPQSMFTYNADLIITQTTLVINTRACCAFNNREVRQQFWQSVQSGKVVLLLRMLFYASFKFIVYVFYLILCIILCVLYCYPLCWPCLSGKSLHWPFSPGIVFIWCLLFLLFQAVDW